MVRIRHLFLSEGHSFFGRHGGEPGTFAMREVEQVECLAGRGLLGDRFLDYKANYKGQVTFFAWEVHEALLAALGCGETPPYAYRRNVVTEGLELAALIGAEFELQGVRFHGTAECSPCYWMDRAVAPGAEAFLKGRGGLRARILTDGALRRG